MNASLRQLFYLLRVAEKGSFTAAANTLNVTQPALSIAVAQLEREVGAALFDRGSPLKLTEYGETLRRYALRVQNDLREAEEEIAALRRGALGRLDLSMGPSAAGDQVGAVLAGMMAEFPNLEIHVRSGVLPATAEGLLNGEFSVHLGSVAEGFEAGGLDLSPVAELPMVVVGAATHPLADGRAVTPPELLQNPWLMIGNLDQNLPRWRDAFLAARLPAPRPAIDVRNLELVRQLLLGGRLLTVLPLPMVHADLRAGTFARLHPATFNWRLRLDAVTRAGVTLPAAAGIFLTRVREAVAGAEHKPH